MSVPDAKIMKWIAKNCTASVGMTGEWSMEYDPEGNGLSGKKLIKVVEELTEPAEISSWWCKKCNIAIGPDYDGFENIPDDLIKHIIEKHAEELI